MAWATAILLSAPGVSERAAPGEVLTVTNSSDVVNGDTSSPANLIASPGSDGISLREALEAANKVPGPRRITVSASLRGQALTPTTALPPITQDGITIEGPVDGSGEPAFTIQGPLDGRSPFNVFASDFTFRNLRAAGLRFVNGISAFLQIRSGSDPGRPGEPAIIRNIRIEGNVFTNEGLDDDANGVTIATANGQLGGGVENVVIVRNRFHHYAGNADGIGLGLGGENGHFTGIIVADNVFTENSFPVELAPSGSNNAMSGVVIRNNVFRDNFQAITLAGTIQLPGFPTASGNVLERVEILGNHIEGSENPAVGIVVGLAASHNVVRDVVVANNRIAGNRTCGICVACGTGGAATGNLLRDLRVVNNTITGVEFAAGVSVFTETDGSTGNRIEDIVVRNTIFANEEGQDVGGESGLVRVDHSLTRQPGLVGVDGNVSGDPRFVDAAGGDFRVRPGSPAIDAGTSEGAPRVDAEGKGRVDDPGIPNTGAGQPAFGDIGAYEHVPPGGGAPCAPGPAALCLNASRFRVEVDWETPAGATGVGGAVPLTADTGYLWFFSRENVEVVVKVLDGCGFNERYWTFAGGLTNVETLLTVTDTRTGAAHQYSNPQGTPFRPIQDTAAFAVCSGVRSGGVPAGPDANRRHAEKTDRENEIGRMSTSCAEDITTLCLNGNRFKVTAAWRSAQASGTGMAVKLTGDSGYFWFFTPDNVEVIVKALNACGFNSRYWVFSAGLTDVEVMLTVTDVLTGGVQTYRNPLGTSFPPILDTSAFATCP